MRFYRWALLALLVVLAAPPPAEGQALASPYNLAIYPTQSATGVQQLATIQLNGLLTPSLIGSSFNSGSVTVAGTGLTTVTFSVYGSFDNGATFYALPLNILGTPGTTANSITTTANGVWQFPLTNVSHVYIKTTGTFTAASVAFTTNASPNGILARGGGGGGGGAVGSVFGRTGVVVAANGDYSFSMLSGAPTATQVGAAVGGTGLMGVVSGVAALAMPSNLQASFNSFMPHLTSNNLLADSAGNYNSNSFTCTTTILPGDPGFISGGPSCIAIPVFNDWGPGWDYGVPGNYPTDDYGWYFPYMLSLTADSHSAGIHSGIELLGRYTGSGDINFLNLTTYVRPAQVDGSGESYHMVRFDTNELNEYQATIVTGGSGAQTLSVNCIAFCPQVNSSTGFWQGGSMGLQSSLIDLNTRTACTLSAFTPSVYGNSGAWQATTSCTVPVSLTGTLAGAIAVPRVVANNTLALSHRTVTVTLNTTADLSIANLPINVMADPTGEPNFNEVVEPISYGTYNSGAHTQTITAVFYFSHTAGSKFFAGGPVGQYFEPYEPGWVASNPYGVGLVIVDTNDHLQQVTTAGTSNSGSAPSWNSSGGTTTSGTAVFTDRGLRQQRYVEQILGSTGANTVWLGHQVPTGYAQSILFAFANSTSSVAGALYQGAEVMGVLNPSASTGCGIGNPTPCAAPDGSFLVLSGNSAPFTTGHTVENVNNQSASYAVDQRTETIQHLYAPVLDHIDVTSTIGGLAGPTKFEFQNLVSSSYYNGAGGPYYAPKMFYIEGPFSTFYASEFYPLAGSNQSGGLNARNCAGSILCSANGPAPGAISHSTAIWKAGDSGDAITIDHDTDTFNFSASHVTWNGTPLAVVGTPVTLLTGEWVPSASTSPGYACIYNTNTNCLDGNTNNNSGSWGIVFDTNPNNQWIGGGFGTTASLKITAETPGTPGVLENITFYGYGYNTPSSANGQITMTGVNSSYLFLVDSGQAGHGGHFCFGCSLGDSVIPMLQIVGDEFITGNFQAALNTLIPTIVATFGCASGNAGNMAAFTDSTTQVWGATITGGGSLPVLGYCDGTNWTVFGK